MWEGAKEAGIHDRGNKAIHTYSSIKLSVGNK